MTCCWGCSHTNLAATDTRVGSCGWSASDQRCGSGWENVIKASLELQWQITGREKRCAVTTSTRLSPTRVPSCPVEHIQSASVCSSLTMKDYDSTKVPLTQLYSRYGRKCNREWDGCQGMAGCVKKKSHGSKMEWWRSYGTKSAEERQKDYQKTGWKWKIRHLQKIIFIIK